MSFYDLEDKKQSNDSKITVKPDYFDMNEEELSKEFETEYEDFITNVAKLDAVLLGVTEEDNDSPKYSIKDVVDAIKENGETLNSKEKETFIKNIKNGRVGFCMGIYLKDFSKNDAVDIGYKLYHLSWKIANMRGIKKAQKVEKEKYYKQFGKDFL